MFRREFLKSSLFVFIPKRKQGAIEFDPIEKYNLETFEHTRFTYEMKQILLKTEFVEPIVLCKDNGRSKQCPGN